MAKIGQGENYARTRANQPPLFNRLFSVAFVFAFCGISAPALCPPYVPLMRPPQSLQRHKKALKWRHSKRRTKAGCLTATHILYFVFGGFLPVRFARRFAGAKRQAKRCSLRFRPAQFSPFRHFAYFSPFSLCW